jgi:hypothetical protein
MEGKYATGGRRVCADVSCKSTARESIPPLAWNSFEASKLGYDAALFGK